MGREEKLKGFQWKNLTEGDYLEDPGVDGRLILKWIFERLDGSYALDRAGSGQEQVVGSCECVDEPSGSIKCGEFLE
jgi:hypothetical protein